VGRGLGVEEVETLSVFAAAVTEPDLVVVLDLPDERAEERVAAEADRMERAGPAFHAAVRDAYRTLARRRGWVVVDASGTRDEVAARVWAAVAPVL
jgi:dTMP kinase